MEGCFSSSADSTFSAEPGTEGRSPTGGSFTSAAADDLGKNWATLLNKPAPIMSARTTSERGEYHSLLSHIVLIRELRYAPGRGFYAKVRNREEGLSMAEDAEHPKQGCPVSHKSATQLECEARCHLGSESPASIRSRFAALVAHHSGPWQEQVPTGCCGSLCSQPFLDDEQALAYVCKGRAR